MPELKQQECSVCHVGAPKINKDKATQMMTQIPDWVMIERDNIPQLERVFKFKNFKQAIAFTNKVGEMSEQEGHHPALLTEWGKLTVTWWSHSIKGLHENDFICAAKTDALL